MNYFVIYHGLYEDKCHWSSEPMDKKAREERGVPWYCDECGQRIYGWASGTLDELNKWKQKRAALKESE